MPNATTLTYPDLEDRLIQARLLFNLHCPFLGRLVNRVPTFFDEKAKTARCINRGSMGEIQFAPTFCSSLSMGEFNWVFGHEVLHLALGAFARRGRRNLRKWNRTHDYLVNAMLAMLAETLPVGILVAPAGILLDLDLSHGRMAEEIFEILESRTEDNEKAKSGSNGPSEPGSGDQDGNQSGEAASAGEGEGFTDWSDCMPDPDTPMAAQEAQDRELAQRWANALAGALQAQGQTAGALPGCITEVVRGLFKPKMPFLDGFLGLAAGVLPDGPMTYLKPNPRALANGIALPRRSNRIPQVAVVLDTSRSIGERYLQAFLGALRAVVGVYEPAIRLIETDAKVQMDRMVEDLESELLAYNGLEIHGRGGTDFQDVLAALPLGERDPDLILILTDGHVTWPRADDWPCPVLVVTTHLQPPDGYLAATLEAA